MRTGEFLSLCFYSHSGSQFCPVITLPFLDHLFGHCVPSIFATFLPRNMKRPLDKISLNFSLTQPTNLPSCRNLTRIFCGPGCQVVKEICGGRVVVLGTGTQPILAISSHCAVSQAGGRWHLTIVYKLLRIPNYPNSLNMLTSALWVREKGRVIVRSQGARTPHPVASLNHAPASILSCFQYPQLLNSASTILNSQLLFEHKLKTN